MEEPDEGDDRVILSLPRRSLDLIEEGKSLSHKEVVVLLGMLSLF
ncbi:MAG: hypothetical protein O7F10_04010 [Deltaproteobacteria bacterium]|nr:hypothetical protein [Deltaproteobacteria bacterium]